MICLNAHFFAGLLGVYHFLEFAKSLLFFGFYTQNIVGVVVLVCKLSRYASAETKRALEKFWCVALVNVKRLFTSTAYLICEARIIKLG